MVVFADFTQTWCNLISVLVYHWIRSYTTRNISLISISFKVSKQSRKLIMNKIISCEIQKYFRRVILWNISWTSTLEDQYFSPDQSYKNKRPLFVKFAFTLYYSSFLHVQPWRINTLLHKKMLQDYFCLIDYFSLINTIIGWQYLQSTINLVFS